MATGAANLTLAQQARRRYTEEVVRHLPSIVQAVNSAALGLLERPAEHAVMQRRRDVAIEVPRRTGAWHTTLVQALQRALAAGGSATRFDDLPWPGASRAAPGLALVDDDTIEREILGSRLALAVMDRAAWEFTDLRSRVAALESRGELEPHDLLRAHVLARLAVEAWRAAELPLAAWRELQPTLHQEFAALVEETYHETNRWLKEQGVLPEVDLRPLIRRSRDTGLGGATTRHGIDSALGPGGDSRFGGLSRGAGGGTAGGAGAPGFGQGGAQDAGHAGGRPSTHGGDVPTTQPGVLSPGATTRGGGLLGSRTVPGRAGVQDETRLMTRSGPTASPIGEQAREVLGRLNRLVGRQLPGFGDAARTTRPASPALRQAMDAMQVSLRQRLEHEGKQGLAPPTAPVLLDALHRNKQALKNAAETPVERATIEIVALLFQSILTEDRIPATVRVWFARLQMPVLRVAIVEPDFFATLDHPARRLIDRMGACVMGFDAARAIGDALEKEIKRVVQVVEAYPDTGRRVFQTVLTEFETFLEHYFRHENEASKRGVSLAQQVEQRETLAIQYTIELRKMLDEVPVQDGVRQFLFQVWADVLATTALRHGAQGEETRAMKRAAADLIWSAGAKVSREERAEVLRRLPPLLKTLREGMASAGVAADKQDEHIQALNNSLAAAFSAKAAAIPQDRLEELTRRLEALEALLPEGAELDIDDSMVPNLADHESEALEVVGEGGSMPTAAMLAWARELQVGAWFMLDYRNRNEAVQLAWQGMRRRLSLFVNAHGRAVLFQQHRLASFLQAGLLLPAQDEALTVRATRTALAKLDVDPGRLVN
jgi:hypothetical protein